MLETLTTFLNNLLNKGFMFIFFISCLYTLRQTILFFIKAKSGEKFIITQKGLQYLGISIAIILTIIFSGIKLI